MPVALQDERATVGVADSLGYPLGRSPPAPEGRVVVITFPAELVEEQARKVFATLDDASADTLHAFIAGLEYAEPPVWYFRLPIYYAATNRECGELPDGLAMITMRAALRNSVTWRDGELIDTLENARSPFWVAVREALVAIVEASELAS